ncbi:MAG TPA: DedA family protein [Solirubrobacteraceae bacterium]|nr:DedA family protein [Solirubrobacteraceae bacterium]
MIAAITDLIRSAGYVGLFAVVLAENLVPPIPSEIVLPFAGWEVAQGELALLPALVAATAGSVTGALILYWIARRGGRRAILATHRVSRVTAADLDRVDARFRRHGVWLVLTGRCVPGLRSVISVPAGMAHMHVGLFVALTALGSAVWNTVLIGAGIALGSQFEEVDSIIGPLSTAVVAALAFVIFIVLVKLRRRGTSSS